VLDPVSTVGQDLRYHQMRLMEKVHRPHPTKGKFLHLKLFA